MKHTVEIKRAYDPASATDGYRIYVDRLWPRGLSHENFHYDWWDKAIAPSTTLREWFHGAGVGVWDEFAARYKAELAHNPAYSALLEAIADKPKVTLLYSSHDREHNNAAVLAAMIESAENQ
ncbi:MAG: DUF488 family protein [Muribaculaceae bacterium]|nr:DUF488 family protein [Muribaculaceae bacterium]